MPPTERQIQYALSLADSLGCIIDQRAYDTRGAFSDEIDRMKKQAGSEGGASRIVGAPATNRQRDWLRRLM